MGERGGPRGAITAMLRPERDLYAHRLNTHHSQKSEARWTEGTMGEDGVGSVSSVWGLILEFSQYNCVSGLILSCIRPRLVRVSGTLSAAILSLSGPNQICSGQPGIGRDRPRRVDYSNDKERNL